MADSKEKCNNILSLCVSDPSKDKLGCTCNIYVLQCSALQQFISIRDLVRHEGISGFNQTCNYFYACNTKICINEFMVIWQSEGIVFINVETAAGKSMCKSKENSF